MDCINILVSKDEAWHIIAGQAILREIQSVISKRKICNLVLTGGNSAKILYGYLASLPQFPFDQINFFFGDERCVSLAHEDSNYRMAKNTLFKNYPYKRLHRIKFDPLGVKAACDNYEKVLPDEIDILILSMGADGHIASLFPNNPALMECKRKVAHVSHEGVKHERITITPKFIRQAKSTFLLAKGSGKGEILANALASQDNFNKFPVCLILNATLVLDYEAAKKILEAK